MSLTMKVLAGLLALLVVIATAAGVYGYVEHTKLAPAKAEAAAAEAQLVEQKRLADASAAASAQYVSSVAATKAVQAKQSNKLQETLDANPNLGGTAVPSAVFDSLRDAQGADATGVTAN